MIVEGGPHGTVAKQPHLDVRVDPAIGLSVHGLRTECGSNQEHILAREGSLAHEKAHRLPWQQITWSPENGIVDIVASN